MQFSQLKRRQFITLLGGAAAWPLVALAQRPPMPVIGFVSGGSPEPFAYLVRAFREGLKQTGYIDGQNVAIEFQWADGKYDQLPEMVGRLVQRQVTVLVATTTPAAVAAKAATATIPIVFATESDPVQIGLAASLNRPGGNATGSAQSDFTMKRVELIMQLFADRRARLGLQIGLLENPTNPRTDAVSRALEKLQTAESSWMLLHHFDASSEDDLATVFQGGTPNLVQALVISADPFFTSRAEQLATWALRYRVPAIHEVRDFVISGGLMSYGGRHTDSYRQVGIYTGRILKGEKPANLPIVRSTKVEVIVNLNTAKDLRVTIPRALLRNASEVIQ
jgi:putative tryptophan/tyrosine transport system substrate-binding protein